VTKNRGVGGGACVCLLVGLFLPWGGIAAAAPPAPPAAGDVVKVRALLVSVDKAGRSMVYEREHKQMSARVREDALAKLEGMRPGQVVELTMQIQHDEWPLVFEAKKPRNKMDYLLFVLGALFVQFVPGG
jgi:hypothetical protein